jgi:tRNA G18 (ribose-2'-O)-methylase SpoU
MARIGVSSQFAGRTLKEAPPPEKRPPALDGRQPSVYQRPMPEQSMRGFFAIGAEGISKPMNLGNLVRSAHAFGASFVFLVNADYGARRPGSDTSQAEFQLPVYDFASADELQLPRGCRLVGCELVDDAVDLPSFRHPLRAAYVLGPERGVLTEALLARCDYVVKIPTSFCINVAMAGAIVMYDRVRTLGRFAPRPISEGGPTEAAEAHVYGEPISSGKPKRSH